MADLYSTVISNPVGKTVAKQLGLPRPATLRRGRTMPSGPVAVAVLGKAGPVGRALSVLNVPTTTAVLDAPEARAAEAGGTPVYDSPLGALVVDATAVTTVADLESVRAALRPALRALAPSGRVVVVGPDPLHADGVEATAAARALDGIVRSVGKELRAGGTANLVLVAPGTTPKALASTLSFLLEGRSAYVSGQPVHVGTAPDVPSTRERPFEGLVVVVTGSARGIGKGIAEVFAREGASLVLVDVPAAGDALTAVANRLGATALQLDITAADAGERIAGHVAARHGEASRIHAVVHNAGITRDKLLVNTDEARWASVLDVNLNSILKMNEALLGEGGIRDGGHIVLVSSIAGISGNRGQANYAASKAGVIGLVETMSRDHALVSRGVTVNAVAPGFIETEMTARIPFATREVGRRLNSLSQGGLPVDVAETIAFFSQDASAAVSGNVVRVCGQGLMGA